jgi:hypothetical protein
LAYNFNRKERQVFYKEREVFILILTHCEHCAFFASIAVKLIIKLQSPEGCAMAMAHIHKEKTA